MVLGMFFASITQSFCNHWAKYLDELPRSIVMLIHVPELLDFKNTFPGYIG